MPQQPANHRPAIDIWYGDSQRFGALGDPQPLINVLGSVRPADELKSLMCSLNGRAAHRLSVGSDSRRLARAGDFNIEIPRAELHAGENQLSVSATFRGSATVSRIVRIHRTEGRNWPLPFEIDWSEVEQIQDVAQVVDGRWELTPTGLRTAEPYYDRTVAIGDMAWTDYEVLTSVVFHRIFAEEVVTEGPPFSHRAHASLLMRWQGHADDGMHPRKKWQPTGALAMLRAEKGQPGNRWVIHGGESGILAEQEQGLPIELETPYLLKARVVSLHGPRTRYSVKAWKSGDEEPENWDLVAIDGARDVHSGSLLLVVHHSDVTFGNINIRPL